MHLSWFWTNYGRDGDQVRGEPAGASAVHLECRAVAAANLNSHAQPCVPSSILFPSLYSYWRTIRQMISRLERKFDGRIVRRVEERALSGQHNTIAGFPVTLTRDRQTYWLQLVFRHGPVPSAPVQYNSSATGLAFNAYSICTSCCASNGGCSQASLGFGSRGVY